MKENETISLLPVAEAFVTSPLRNRIKLELNTPLEKVWSVVGHPGRMSEYSTGLDQVITEKSASGNYSAYVCHYKPLDDEEAIVHRAKIVWYAPKTGWASIDDEPNAFELQQSLTFITLRSRDNKTILTWDMHFTTESEEVLEMNVFSLDLALSDIAQNLIHTFGGRLVEQFAEGQED